jgi:alcohol dehydrogenase, propanol-preferring
VFTTEEASVKAFQLVAWESPPELRDVPVPEPGPGPGQVLVKVGGAGACHSDLHLMNRPDFNQSWTI